MRVLSDVLWSGPRSLNDAHGAHNDTIERIIGARAWLSLPAAVRTRFARVEPTLYRGRTDTRLSLVGRLFAWALFPFGAPLPVIAGASDASVKVGVKHGGTSWTREYRGPLGLAFRVRSIKRPSADGGLFECCAGGWTMLLDVSADQGSLVFRSRKFFWRWRGVSVPLPVWITPGVAEVRHTDLGEGRFLFTLTFDHPLFGRTIDQTGEFEDPESSWDRGHLARSCSASASQGAVWKPAVPGGLAP
jgi:hypothetical protein